MRHLIPLLFTATAFAAEGTTLVEVAVPDGARLRAHVDASIYGQLWADPAFAPLRARCESQLAELKANQGVDLPRWYGALTSAGVIAHAPAAEGADPSAALMVDVGALAPELFTMWRTKTDGASPANVPGADEAFTKVGPDGGSQLVARLGSLVASTSDGSPIPAWRPSAGKYDLSLRLDGPALGTVLAARMAQGGQVTGALLTGPALTAAYGHVTYDLTVVPEGVHERIVTDAVAPWLIPVDRAALDRLPANALTCLAVGINGKQLWTIIRTPMLTLMADAQGLSIEDGEDALNANLAQFGVETGLADLIGGVKGTITVAISPAAPFPAVTLSIPRSTGIDELVTALATQIGGEVPAVGGSSMLPLPGAPLMLTLACDQRHWLVTSDPAQATAWLGGAVSGWSTTPTATLALDQAGTDAVLIGASDTPTLVRTLIPFIALGMGRTVEQKVKQASLASLGRVAALAKTGWIVGRARREGGVEVELRGLTGYALMPAVIAAIAIPNLLESRVSANEAAAASSLKSGVHPAQIQFQAGSYVDADGNGIGDFGFFPEMSGGPVPGVGIKLALLPPTWNAPTPLASGYRFATWVYAGPGAASADANERAAAKAPAEQNFVAYAWPSDRGQGRRIFAISAGGTVHAMPWDGNPPEWFALWGAADKAWTNPPLWPAYRR